MINEDNWEQEVTAKLVIGKGDQMISVTNLEGYQPWPVKMTGKSIEIPLTVTSNSGLTVTFSVWSDNADVAADFPAAFGTGQSSGRRQTGWLNAEGSAVSRKHRPE